MEKEFNIIKNLTGPQRLEFNSDMQQLFLQCHKTLKGRMDKLKDVVVNLNLKNEVYLKVLCEYDNLSSNKVKITELYKYKSEKEYNQALAIERANLN
ncbi:hypothetical protein HSX10_05060 [Winogradskyella undariae]|uniref:hypothetical protein n=1 Tax=Winogradskyella undariae TaxID=1285465 RepID=UPI00156BA0E5|nr:hypothetical protein [Winogradskyella undariae]NRR90927.1 hypothetical protein [Winogradskyella undariae]